jgi:hypothetical protein
MAQGEQKGGIGKKGTSMRLKDQTFLDPHRWWLGSVSGKTVRRVDCPPVDAV